MDDVYDKKSAKTKEQYHQEDLERLRNFRPIDDTFMRGLFKDNIPLAELVLRIITGKSDLVITSCETQADMKRVTGAKSVCLDAYATDSSGKKYDIEIQRADNGASPYRARYNQSVLDVENLDEGQDVTELPETYVIFITEEDYYKAGKPMYIIHNINATLEQPFNDGRHILYVNGQYRDDSDIGRLMHDFNCRRAEDMNYKILADKTRYLKESKEGVSEMCKAMEDLRNESYADGRADGIAIGRADGVAVGEAKVIVMMHKKGFSAEQIASATDKSIGDVESILAKGEPVMA